MQPLPEAPPSTGPRSAGVGSPGRRRSSGRWQLGVCGWDAVEASPPRPSRAAAAAALRPTPSAGGTPAGDDVSPTPGGAGGTPACGSLGADAPPASAPPHLRSREHRTRPAAARRSGGGSRRSGGGSPVALRRALATAPERAPSPALPLPSPHPSPPAAPPPPPPAAAPRASGRRSAAGASGCNCRNSRCLKLYCVCFSAGGVCGPGCACVNCANKDADAEEVRRAAGR